MKTGSYIYYYSMLYFEDEFIVFGGYRSSTRSVIAKLDLATTSWAKLGDLKVGRWYHNVIFDGEVFIVVGGSGSMKTEKCTLSGSTMTCSEQTPTLTNYYAYPALVMVPEDFCTEV